MKLVAFPFLFSILGFVGCITTVATPTPDIPATVTAAVEAALPTVPLTPTPDIDATVETRPRSLAGNLDSP